MKIGDALQNVSALGIDTSPFIYFVERHPMYLNLVREIFKSIDTAAFVGYCSTVTLTEVLTQPKRTQNRQLENEYRDLLTHSRNLTLVSIIPEIADTAAELRSRYRLRTPDALQIAAALESRCQAFLTNDADLQRVKELRVLVLDRLEL
ncbi:MAG: PIN domain-containing protein [Pyrinomonadaceae bacterium]|nr:PIN domain-containing protein [Pyrinomonadaceae bacterium]